MSWSDEYYEQGLVEVVKAVKCPIAGLLRVDECMKCKFYGDYDPLPRSRIQCLYEGDDEQEIVVTDTSNVDYGEVEILENILADLIEVLNYLLPGEYGYGGGDHFRLIGKDDLYLSIENGIRMLETVMISAEAGVEIGRDVLDRYYTHLRQKDVLDKCGYVYG